jgi:hypothetical protein
MTSRGSGPEVRTPSTLLAAFALLTVAACGAPGQVDGGPANGDRQELAQDAGPVHQQTLYFGGQYRFDNGVTVVVSPPKSFQPSSSAYPRSNRAAAFEISVRNDGGQPYQLSGLSVAVTIAGVPTKQVVDATQGYSGIVDADKDLAPNHDMQVALAFVVPDQPTELTLSVRPAAESPVAAIYRGTA